MEAFLGLLIFCKAIVYMYECFSAFNEIPAFKYTPSCIQLSLTLPQYRFALFALVFWLHMMETSFWDGTNMPL